MVFHRFFHNHISAKASDVGRMHICQNRFTGHTKYYLKLNDESEYRRISHNLANKLLRAISVLHAKAIIAHADPFDFIDEV